MLLTYRILGTLKNSIIPYIIDLTIKSHLLSPQPDNFPTYQLVILKFVLKFIATNLVSLNYDSGTL